jgi:hypothetical protein
MMNPPSLVLPCLLQETKHLPVAQVVVVVTGTLIGNNFDLLDDKIPKRNACFLIPLRFIRHSQLAV